MARPHIKAAVEARMAEALSKARLSVETVHADLRAAFEVDRRDFFRPDKSFKHPHELTREQMNEIEGLEVEEVFRVEGKGKTKTRKLLAVNVTKIKFAKRLAVRDQGMRHFGLFAKDSPGGDGANADDVASKVRERVAEMRKATEAK